MYGFNERLGLVSYPPEEDMSFNKPYGETTAKIIDEEVAKIIENAHSRTLALLTERKAELETIAELLLDKEKITGEDMQAAIGDRPFEDQRGGFVVPGALPAPAHVSQ